MAIEIVETAKCDLKNPILIDGFPGLGLVGTISASYLVEKLKMESLGYITSDKFPPLAAVHNHVPLYPARIYMSKKYNLIIVLSEFIVPMEVVFELAQKLMQYAKEKKVSKIISLGGITIKGDQDTVYAIASSPSLRDDLAKRPKVKLIKEGATTGVTGVLLAEGAVRKFPVVSLLAEAHADYMDPKAASMVIQVLCNLIKIKVDVADLEKESRVLETKMRDLIAKSKQVHTHYKKAENQQSLGPMYG